MSNRILLASRKGVFVLQRKPDGWQIESCDFVGQTATIAMRDPRDESLYVGFNHGHFGAKLHRSSDQGRSWTEVAVPKYPPFTDADRERQAQAGEIGARRDFSSLKELWELTPGGADEPGTIWAGTIPGGLFRSRDRGESWELIESLWFRDDRWHWFGGGKDHPGIHSVMVDPRDSRCVTVGISCGGVWHTRDGGACWEVRAKGMRAEYMPPELAYEPNAQDPHRLVHCPASPDHWWVQHHNGIFRTSDAGLQWDEITGVKPSAFGFAVVVHPRDPNTAWFAPAVKDECRVPVEARMVVTRTRDAGQSFEQLTDGLPQTHCYDIIFRHCLDIDETGERLVMASSTGSVWISEDSGDHWQTISTHLPPIYCARFA